MTETPWRTDRPLDADVVRRVLRSQFPAIDAAAVKPIGDGWDFDAYEIDGRWVFRFPKRREYDGRFLSELALLDEIAGQLPLPVPLYEFRGQPCQAFPYHFGGYAKLTGQPARDVDPSGPALDAIAAQFGDFLHCLHECGVDRFSKLGLYGPADEGTADEHRKETLDCLVKLKSVLPGKAYERCLKLFQDPSRMPPRHSGPLCLVHGDLLPGHMLIDVDARRVTGIIDWSDAAISDPMGDFVGLWMWGGDDLVEGALRAYQRATDSGMCERVRYRGLSVTIGELYYAREQGYGPYAEFCRKCLRREMADD